MYKVSSDAVKLQGYMIDTIENTVTDIDENVGEGKRNISEVHRRQAGNRSMIIKMFTTLYVITFVYIVFLSWKEIQSMIFYIFLQVQYRVKLIIKILQSFFTSGIFVQLWFFLWLANSYKNKWLFHCISLTKIFFTDLRFPRWLNSLKIIVTFNHSLLHYLISWLKRNNFQKMMNAAHLIHKITHLNKKTSRMIIMHKWKNKRYSITWTYPLRISESRLLSSRTQKQDNSSKHTSTSRPK